VSARLTRWAQCAAPALALLLASCVVGPSFTRPAAPAASYPPASLAPTTATTGLAGGEAQHFDAGGDIPADWWRLFHSAELNALVERALAANPDLKAARAALTAAHESTLAQRGAYFPAVTGSFSASRNKSPAPLSPVPSSGALLYSLYTPEVSVSYVPDVFGLNHRMVEGLAAQEEATRFELAAARITLSTNVALAAIGQASIRGQIETTRALIELNTRALEMLRRQLAGGYAGRLDVAAQEAQLAQQAATLPPLLQQLALENDLLAALTGSAPQAAPPAALELAQLELPQQLPVSLPSQLIDQRPDVRQAEANLHAASAAVGVAIANRLPNLTLTADLGDSALALNQLFGPGTGFWDLGAGLTAPVFAGGTLLHRQRAAQAAFEQAREQYRSTVLSALENVADTLSALRHDADTLAATAAAEAAARTTLELVQRQQQAGYAGYLQLLSAEQSYQQALLGRVQAQASRYADTAALFQALGGGWWNLPASELGAR
jgi:NodT family efflux transporter outer membrane factor (OMF) lipoprotein